MASPLAKPISGSIPQTADGSESRPYPHADIPVHFTGFAVSSS